MLPDPALAYNELIKDVLWPAFKRLGYKKSGNNFRYYNADGLGKIVQFQKSSYNSATALSFTVNIGLYLLDYDAFFGGETSGQKFQEPACVVRKRIGMLDGSTVDEWFELTDITDKELLFSQLEGKFERYVHPYLAAIEGPEAIYAMLLAGHRADHPSQQIHLLYQKGYQEAALKLFSNEFARSKSNKYYRATLRELAKTLNLPSVWVESFDNG